MASRNATFLANSVLALLSLAFTLAAAELFLRFGMDPSRLVPNAPEAPLLNARRNELRFMEHNRNRDPAELGGHDPQFGWDARPRQQLKAGEARSNADRLAIALGDSFVFGNEVAADENFVALLDEADNGLQVLNMGVPGYGVDQSYLKFEQQALTQDPDVVLFGVYVSDYERSTVAFTAGSKPLFEMTGLGARLTNQPVPSPASELNRIRTSLKGTSYLLEFLRNRQSAARASSDAFFLEGDRIITHVLSELKNALEEDQRLILIHFPRGESFVDPDPFHQEMNRRLLAIYQALHLETIDLERVFREKHPAAEVPAAYYVIRDSGSIGHLNPAGHRLAAQVISRALAPTR